MRSFIFRDAEDGHTHHGTLLTDRKANVSFVQTSCGLRRTWWVQVLPYDTSVTCPTCQRTVVFAPRLYVPGRR